MIPSGCSLDPILRGGDHNSQCREACQLPYDLSEFNASLAPANAKLPLLHLQGLCAKWPLAGLSMKALGNGWKTNINFKLGCTEHR